jgi:hypothetical protein
VVLWEHPETVLELGSDSVVSLDENEEYAHQTRGLFSEHGLDKVATILLAPLVSTPLPGGPVLWYELRSLPPTGPIDFLVVIAPCRRAGPETRSVTLPCLS